MEPPDAACARCGKPIRPGTMSQIAGRPAHITCLARGLPSEGPGPPGVGRRDTGPLRGHRRDRRRSGRPGASPPRLPGLRADAGFGLAASTVRMASLLRSLALFRSRDVPVFAPVFFFTARFLGAGRNGARLPTQVGRRFSQDQRLYASVHPASPFVDAALSRRVTRVGRHAAGGSAGQHRAWTSCSPA
jgi:hypothetical protein